MVEVLTGLREGDRVGLTEPGAAAKSATAPGGAGRANALQPR
jgi:hypothetical protein